MWVYLYVSSCLYFTMCVFFLFSLGSLIYCHVQFVACTFVTCFNKDQSINHIMGSISDRHGACIGQNTARTVTCTLLANQLDMTEPEIVYCERPWPLGLIAVPSGTIRRSCWPKYSKNERQEAAGDQTGSGNMAATWYFNSATPTSYLTSYTLCGLSLTVTELVFENVNIMPC